MDEYNNNTKIFGELTRRDLCGLRFAAAFVALDLEDGGSEGQLKHAQKWHALRDKINAEIKKADAAHGWTD